MHADTDDRAFARVAADLDVDGCRRLAAAVLRSGLELPDGPRAVWIASPWFAWWCQLAGLSPDVMRRELTRPRRPRRIVTDEEE